MMSFKKTVCMLLVLITILQVCIMGPAFAAEYGVQPAPQMLTVEPLHNTPPDDIQPPIGYNEFDKNYIDLEWNALASPEPAPAAINKRMNFYLQEVNKAYKPSKPEILKENNISGNTTALRMKSLSSGTIYYTYATAFYTYPQGNSTGTSPESEPSNTVKFLTDIAIDAYSSGSNEIEIKWDDVWNTGSRISYKLYVSENSTFGNTPPIYIGQEQIGPDKPVTVNEATGKLEYTHIVADSGRVYYIKIVPDTSDTELKKSLESKTVTVSSFILAKTTKMSMTNFGTIWRLDWSPVVTSLGDSNVKIAYHIYRAADLRSVPQYIAAVDDTSFFITLQPGEDSSYYIIKAVVTKNGQDVYPNIKIESDKIYVKESLVPSYPAAPELVDKFMNVGMTIISYSDELKSDSATILWRAPRNGSGEIDTEILYDIWMFDDPSLINNPPDNSKIASSVRMDESNFVMDSTALLGYKYAISDLASNTTYYFKIIAKKVYVEYEDNTLKSTTYSSQAALRVVITPSGGAIDQPLTPGRPPLQIKKSPPPESMDMITQTSAVIQLKNKWYEEFNSIMGKWEYKTSEQLDDAAAGTVASIEAGTANPLQYRKVEYDPGVTIDVGCIKYEDGMIYDDLKSVRADKVLGFPATPNDPLENAVDNNDHLKHNIDITLTDLDPNTTYVVWVRAARRSADLISGPSDPIIITTSTDLAHPLEKPVVPVINYSYGGDVYVDLGWDYRPGYNYYIKYGTVENIGSADGNAEVKAEDLLYANHYRISGLKPSTIYYFWIQAEVINADADKSLSDWSDSYIVKTLSVTPPEAPKGFGIRSFGGPDGKDSITYEWIKEDGMEYVLQLSSDAYYSDFKEYEAGSLAEFKAEGLRSNYRYYARLYAYDPDKKLRSEPTQSVSWRTERSTDDYDSNQDVESMAAGDFVVKDPVVVNKTWNVRVAGINAERLVEHINNDRVLDYRLKLDSPPAGVYIVKIFLAGRVFAALNSLKENLIIVNPGNELVIRPGVLGTATKSSFAGGLGDCDYEISITLSGTAPNDIKDNITPGTAVTGVTINMYNGGCITPVNLLGRPLKVVYTYTGGSWYKEGITSGFIRENGSVQWKRLDTSAVFDSESGKGYLSFETLKTGDMVVAEQANNFFDDIRGHWAKKSINRVASVHRLKSVQGRKFEPDSFASMGEAVKIMLDVLDYDYGPDYMSMAVNSGIISSSDIDKPDNNCTREKIIAMAVRLYELKSGEKAVISNNYTDAYEDMEHVSADLLPKVKFAAENGIVTSRFANTLGPADPVTRAEVMVLLEKLMAFTGEVN